MFIPLYFQALELSQCVLNPQKTLVVLSNVGHLYSNITLEHVSMYGVRSSGVYWVLLPSAYNGLTEQAYLYSTHVACMKKSNNEVHLYSLKIMILEVFMPHPCCVCNIAYRQGCDRLEVACCWCIGFVCEWNLSTNMSKMFSIVPGI